MSAPPPDEHRSRQFELAYIIFVGLFVTALIACNLIFKKFFSIEINLPFIGVYEFTQSVGILPYPLTFLVTDILSEVFGRRRANQAVVTGFFAAPFALAILMIADTAPMAPFSTPDNNLVDNDLFHLVFGQFWAPLTASMAAYLTAQFLDIRVFHLCRRLTGGRHLWLRNNVSTISSQVTDTVLVIGLLCALPGGGITWDRFWALTINGIAFKSLVALLDTPLCYAAVWAMRSRFAEQMDRAHAEDHAALNR